MKKITILETAAFFRVRLEQLLSHYGFHDVEALKDIREKVLIKTLKDSHLVIMDLDNKKIDIVGLIEKLNNDPLTRHIQVILLSSQSDIKTLKKAIDLGCSEFVTKPFSDDLLVEKVHKIMNKAYKNIGLPQLEVNEEENQLDASFSWNDDYEIGIELIDKEHKMIVDSYEKLYTLMKSGKGHEYYEDLIGMLEKYVIDHFSHEEDYQRSINYDKLDEQLSFHREFEDRVSLVVKKYNEESISNLDLIKLNLMIKDWLLHHILVEDAKIKEFLSNQA